MHLFLAVGGPKFVGGPKLVGRPEYSEHGCFQLFHGPSAFAEQKNYGIRQLVSSVRVERKRAASLAALIQHTILRSARYSDSAGKGNFGP